MTGIERLDVIAETMDGMPWLDKLSTELMSASIQIKREQAEDHEIAEWVRERGGLEHVRDIWDEMVNLCATVGCEPDIVTDAIEALGECTDIVNNRLMPPGDGMAALRPKQDPYGADGLPIHDDETVYLVDGNGDPLTVVCIETEGYQTVRVRKPTGYVINYDAQRLTHTKPEPKDSWEQIYSDCDLTGEQYVEKRMEEQPDDMTPEMAKAHDLVRRAEEMAKREEK